VADLWTKRGDLGKDLIQILTDSSGGPLDLTGASGVQFIVRAATADRRLVGKFTGAIDQVGTAPNITNQGQVRCPPTAALVFNAGDFLYEWELSYPGSEPVTVPNNSYGTLRIDPDLG
jgi:hypothetical protein